MKIVLHPMFHRAVPFIIALLVAIVGGSAAAPMALAQGVGGDPTQIEAPHRPGGEANLIIPDLSSVSFLGIPGRTLLMGGLVVCALGLLFGLIIYGQLKRMAVHESMREVSELIYETCKTYLITPGRF